ncbi:hypothetical protein TREMEDRAFT_35270 [Tremella mesenterica DSM 1558]|uniref:uncharacterized protein n=1 Tax=Tremella mesenterica (strain ATCC 24925 / CBS 8224 / DSM 1558 / NBRC 9311 / NRRL Y-6157 / RJB 2259-6 / UBC 559-6) TaxID=578456 RepID=UPI00032D4B11|nr:uncharacterized protein TREMEDRAFT_35270 [Tremella mesenterica DSM 1558]EIW66293.1 hypothetical protein TREMEDRAFT_35270 [Tremella mesenterica DSM 1558]
MPQDDPPVWKVASVVSFYMAVALVMVMVNKWVLTKTSLPLTFLFLQLSIAVLLILLSSLSSPTLFHIPRLCRKTLLALAPLCLVNLIGLIFNIYCLQLVDASYFQVARGLTLPITVLLTSFTSGEKPMNQILISCFFVTYGFTYSFIPLPWISNDKTVEETPILGMLLGTACAMMIAIHAILVKNALKVVDGKMLDLAYWQNLLSAVGLIPFILFSGEIGGVERLIKGEEGDLWAFIIGSGVTGIVGFLICIAGLLSIKVTSPVTHMFSAAVRSVLQTILGVYLFHDVLNTNRIMSIILIILGGLLYTWHKARTQVKPTPPDVAKEPLLSDQTIDLEKGLSEERS